MGSAANMVRRWSSSGCSSRRMSRSSPGRTGCRRPQWTRWPSPPPRVRETTSRMPLPSGCRPVVRGERHPHLHGRRDDDLADRLPHPGARPGRGQAGGRPEARLAGRLDGRGCRAGTVSIAGDTWRCSAPRTGPGGGGPGRSGDRRPLPPWSWVRRRRPMSRPSLRPCAPAPLRAPAPPVGRCGRVSPTRVRRAGPARRQGGCAVGGRLARSPQGHAFLERDLAGLEPGHDRGHSSRPAHS